MTFNNLPEDLVVEILSRVPAVSLARLRSTSKGWNDLIKDGRVLAKKHFAYAPRQPKALLLIDNRVYSVSNNLLGVDNNVDAPSVNVTCHFSLKDPLSNNSSEEVDILDVFHCDGLLLCRVKDYRLMVWNPCSGETRWIQPRDSYKNEHCYILGRSSCNQYKILRQDRIVSNQELNENVTRKWLEGILFIQHRHEYEIYDFTSNSWKGVGVTTDLFIPESNSGMSVNGSTYWFDRREKFLVSIDFSIERFGSEPLPKGDSPFSFISDDWTRATTLYVIYSFHILCDGNKC